MRCLADSRDAFVLQSPLKPCVMTHKSLHVRLNCTLSLVRVTLSMAVVMLMVSVVMMMMAHTPIWSVSLLLHVVRLHRWCHEHRL